MGQCGDWDWFLARIIYGGFGAMLTFLSKSRPITLDSRASPIPSNRHLGGAMAGGAPPCRRHGQASCPWHPINRFENRYNSELQ